MKRLFITAQVDGRAAYKKGIFSYLDLLIQHVFSSTWVGTILPKQPFNLVNMNHVQEKKCINVSDAFYFTKNQKAWLCG